MSDHSFDSAAYFAATSDLELEEVCQALQGVCNLPSFDFDGDQEGRYASAKSNEFKINVTKTDRFDIIRTWMSKAPANVNYQVVFEFNSESHANESEMIERMRTNLEKILHNKVVHYDGW